MEQSLKVSFKTNIKKCSSINEDDKQQEFYSALRSSIQHTLQKYIKNPIHDISAQITKRNIPRLNIANIPQSSCLPNDYLSTKRLKQSEQIIEESVRLRNSESEYQSSQMITSREFPYTIDNVDMKKSHIVQNVESEFQKYIYEKFGYELKKCIQATKILEENLTELENQQNILEQTILEQKIQQSITNFWETIFTTMAILTFKEKQKISPMPKQHVSNQNDSIQEEDSLLSNESTEKIHEMQEMLYMINSLKRRNRQLEQMLEDSNSQQSSFIRSKVFTQHENNIVQSAKNSLISQHLKFVSPERKIFIFNDKQNKNSLNHVSSQQLLKIALPNYQYCLNEVSDQSINYLQESPCFKESSEKKWVLHCNSDVQLSMQKESLKQEQNFSFSCCKQSFQEKNEEMERQISKEKFSAINKIVDRYPSGGSDTIHINDFSVLCQKCRKSASIVNQLLSFDEKMKGSQDSFEIQVNKMLMPLTINIKQQNKSFKLENSDKENFQEQCQSNYECQSYSISNLIDEKCLQNIISKFKELFRKLLTSTTLLCKYSKKLHKYNEKNIKLAENKKNFDKIKKPSLEFGGSYIIKHNLLEENLKEVMEWYKNFSIQCKSINQKVIESFIDQCMQKTQMFYIYINEVVQITK